MDQQTNIEVKQDKIDEFIAEMDAEVAQKGKFIFDKWSDWHLKEISKYSVEQVTAYVFVIDAINFCFWPNNPEGAFEYEHMSNNLETILDEDPEFFTPARLAAVTE